MLSQKKIKEKKIIPVILCAGKGIRYGKLTQKIPKPLIKLKSLNNISILSHLIGSLISLHIEKIVLITGYLNEQIESSVNLLIKHKSNLEGRLVLIHSGNEYKKGPLFSLLSIIEYKNIYTKNTMFIIFPGDTIFEIELLKEVFSLIQNNKDITLAKPCIFFQERQISHLNNYDRKNVQSGPIFISIIESEDTKSEIKVKEIKKINLNLIPKEQPIKLVVPILIFSFEFIEILHKLSLNNPVGEIREILNIYLMQNQNIVPIKLNSKYRFYDIDTSKDLNDFNQINKKKGGQ